MERCETSLEELIETDRFWPSRDFNKQIIIGLNYLHAMNIVHKDLKPSKVLVTRDIHSTLIPNIADFGISKSVNPGGCDDMMSYRGSIGWIAPELFDSLPEDGRPKLNKTVDISTAG